MMLFRRASRDPIPVRVSTFDSDLEFNIPHNATGQLLFEQVAKSIGLRETWYFGLEYRDATDYIAWLDLEEKVRNQELPKGVKYDGQNPLRFSLRVQFYPEDVEEEIIQDVTLRYFFNQVLGLIIADEIYCPPETCVLLASYALQARFGDFGHSSKSNNTELTDTTTTKATNVQCDRYLPRRVIEQHNFTPEQWQERISTLWNGLSGLSREEAMREYLKLAQDLEMYGVAHFEGKNKNNTSLWLGIDARGLNVYTADDKLNPKTAFPWSEIRIVSHNSRKFTIKPKDCEDFAFFLDRARLCRRILTMARGNHKLFVRRRQPDTIEIQHMKSQAAEEKVTKQNEQDRLRAEIEAREQAERVRQLAEERMETLADEMQARQRNLIEAYEQIRALEAQLAVVQSAKDELERRATELEKLNTALAESAQLETTEREKLKKEVHDKLEQYIRLKADFSAKAQESLRLESEVEANRLKRFEDTFKVETGGDQPPSGSTTDDEENQEVSREKELVLVKDEQESPVREEKSDTAVSKKEHLQQQLKQLVEDLEQNVNQGKITRNDELHKANVKCGRDKYKTLRDIRHGNTLRRVEYFENM